MLSAQCNGFPAANLGNDTTICQGSNLVLNPGTGYSSYLWNNGSTSPTRAVNQAGTYSVITKRLSSNVIVNGDFESGDVGFSTDYVYGTGGTYGLLSTEGQYAISTSPSFVHNNFMYCSDHTSGSGNMLIVNGSSTSSTNVWCQTVTILPNTDYSFSCWVSNALNDFNVADLQFYVNGSPIGSIFSPSTSGCLWQQYSNLWNSGSLTSVNLCIVDQSIATSGNDFALDDIVFAPICVTTDTIVVSVQNPTQSLIKTNPTCALSSTGQIDVNNPLATSYTMNGGVTWQTDSFFVNLPYGSYNICSKSSIGCVTCGGAILTDPAPVTIAVNNDTTICQNGTATLSASAQGGTSYFYHWNFIADTINSMQTVMPLVDTFYTVFAENQLGCNSPADTIRVTLNNILTGTISPLTTICAGDSSKLVATVSGGIGAPYSFTWSTGNTSTTNGIDNLTVHPTDSTHYNVIISDGCETSPITLFTTVNVGQLPVPKYVVTNPDQCEPAMFEIINQTDATQSEFVFWTIADNQNFINQDTINTNKLWAGSYDLSMIVTSYQGCMDTLNVSNALTVNPIPVAQFTYNPLTVLTSDPKVNFVNTSINGVTYQWTFEEGDSLTSNELNPIITFPQDNPGKYAVKLIVTSSFGCMDSVINYVDISSEVVIYVPNTFTPDGDQFNQTWKVIIDGIDPYDFDLLIFNRWGEVVWESHNAKVGWDGIYNGQPAVEGTYIWTIRAKAEFSDKKYTYKGNLNLLR